MDLSVSYGGFLVFEIIWVLGSNIDMKASAGKVYAVEEVVFEAVVVESQDWFCGLWGIYVEVDLFYPGRTVDASVVFGFVEGVERREEGSLGVIEVDFLGEV